MYFTTTLLYRKVKNNIRYYKLSISLNLFGEYIFIREYGNVKYRKPTGLIHEYFPFSNEALLKLEKIVKEKYKRGYSKNKSS